MKIISLFSGCGGLDLGFEKAGFKTIWANEYDKVIWETYSNNFPHVHLDKRSITQIDCADIPTNVDGIIGGPPCQSWSEAGALRGINDPRGQLFFDYIRVLNHIKPKFFLAENVSGMLLPRNKPSLELFLNKFDEAGYNVSYKLLNAADYLVPQDRNRVIIVGIRKDLNVKFEFPKPSAKKISLQAAIFDLKDSQKPMPNGKAHALNELNIPNHEYMTGGFSTIYMSRNRVRSWDEQSFTIQAGARHAPIHPDAPKMTFVSQNKRIFTQGFEHLYRRLSVRECARIQTFPDDFRFYYKNISDGYKMVGNAVAPRFAYFLAKAIKDCILNEKKPLLSRAENLTLEYCN